MLMRRKYSAHQHVDLVEHVAQGLPLWVVFNIVDELRARPATRLLRAGNGIMLSVEHNLRPDGGEDAGPGIDKETVGGVDVEPVRTSVMRAGRGDWRMMSCVGTGRRPGGCGGGGRRRRHRIGPVKAPVHAPPPHP